VASLNLETIPSKAGTTRRFVRFTVYCRG